MVSAGLSTEESVNTVCNAKYFAERIGLESISYTVVFLSETPNAHLWGAACCGCLGIVESPQARKISIVYLQSF